MTKLAESRDPAQSRVDWIGTVTFTAALFTLVLAIIRGNPDGWGSTKIVTLFAISGVMMILFVISQVVQKQPMFDLQLFRKPTFDGASIVALTMSAAMFAMFLYITLYIQTLLGYSPLQTGLRFLPFTVVSFVAAIASGSLSDRIPTRFLLGGGLVMVGLGLFLMRGITPTSSWTELLPGFIVAGAGVGFVNPALASAAIGVVPPQRSGMASGINNTFRQVGTATGIAVLGAIFESRQPRAEAHRHARRGPHLPDRARRCGRRNSSGAGRDPCGGPPPGRGGDPCLVHRRDERHLPGGRCDRPDRRNPRAAARPREGLRDLRRRRAGGRRGSRRLGTLYTMYR